MSQAGPNTAFITPAQQDFDTVSFQGSMQQVLQENVGSYVVVDFMLGTGNLTSRQGLLYYVGTQFLVLYDDIYLNYIVCDIFSVKFVTFLMPGCRTVDSQAGVQSEIIENGVPVDPTAINRAPEAPPQDTQTFVPESVMTPAQAAYAHAVRRPGRPLSGRSV